MVRLAVISDIHSNYKAFEAVLAYIREHPVDGVVCLGDYVTDGPYPERTMELLYGMREKYPCYMVRGNREDYLLDNGGNREGWKPSSANGSLYYTSLHLTEADMKFFASLPTEREVRIEGGPPLYICHGTPGRVRGNVSQEPGLRERVMEELSLDYLLGGHSHCQEVFRWKGKSYINPGAVGYAFDGEGRKAQFAILTGSGGGWEAALYAIPYDVEGYLRAFAESGLEDMGLTLVKAVKKSILAGKNIFYECICAMEEEARAAGKRSIAEMPEEVWKKMEGRFGL